MAIADRRFRIEHAQHLRAQDISRFARHKVIASMQPYHAIDDGRWADKTDWAGTRADDLRVSFAARRRRNARVREPTGRSPRLINADHLCGGDSSHARWQTPDGLDSRTKRFRWQRLSAHTRSVPPMPSFRSTRKGTIAPGKLADLVILSQDIFKNRSERD